MALWLVLMIEPPLKAIVRALEVGQFPPAHATRRPAEEISTLNCPDAFRFTVMPRRPTVHRAPPPRLSP